MQPVIRLAKAQEIIPLRWEILRHGLPLAEALIPGDNDDPETLHGGAFVEEKCVACASFFHEAFEGNDGYRLRGMAVDAEYRKHGIGKGVLELLIGKLRERGVTLFWCNGRLPAVPFYERLGWERFGEEFDVPTAGPHYRMVLKFCD